MGYHTEDTICAVATPQGNGGVAMIRVSGDKAFEIGEKCIRLKAGRNIGEMQSHRLFFAQIVDEEEALIDEGVIGIFRAPHSYTAENVLEISCHASPFIQKKILQTLVYWGARIAQPGEFTMRAFMAGKMDLSQAEAVVDLIASETKVSHDIALQQLRGGVSSELKELRSKLLDFASLVELELDFSEEDVDFADRGALKKLLKEISGRVKELKDSFQLGNAIKEGVAVAIIGRPNAGKSTLLNTLLQEEKAIVSDIPGTTRDAIEDVWVLDGISYRFIDTAGLRETEDVIEKAGIGRTLEKMKKANIWLYIFDMTQMGMEEAEAEVETYRNKLGMGEVDLPVIYVGNKYDQCKEWQAWTESAKERENWVLISAKYGEGIQQLESMFKQFYNVEQFAGQMILTNARHYEILGKVSEDIEKVEKGLELQISGDLLAMDIRSALYHLGEITGEVVADDILGNIFGRFCIGK